MFPNKEKGMRPYIFNSDNWCIILGCDEDTAAKTKKYLAQENSQMKEEKEDSMIVISPWNKKFKSFESKFTEKEQKLDVAQGDIFKYIQEVWMEAISTAVFREISRVIAEDEVEKAEESNQQFKYEWMMCSEMQWKSMYQPKDVLEMEIEELCQLMMKQSRLRKMIAGGVISHNLKLIEERNMKQKTTDIQQQKRCKAFGQFQTKVWDPGGFSINI